MEHQAPSVANVPVTDLPATRHVNASSASLQHEATDELQPLPMQTSLTSPHHVLSATDPFSSSPTSSTRELLSSLAIRPADAQNDLNSSASTNGMPTSPSLSTSLSVGPLYEESNVSQPIVIANNAEGLRLDSDARGVETLPTSLAREVLDTSPVPPTGLPVTSSSPVASTSFSFADSSDDQRSITASSKHRSVHRKQSSSADPTNQTETLFASSDTSPDMSRHSRKASLSSNADDRRSSNLRQRSVDLDRTAIPGIPDFHGLPNSRKERERSRSTDHNTKPRESGKSSSSQGGSPAIASNGSRRQLGEWTLGKTLGAGSMGKVKLAVSNVTAEKVGNLRSAGCYIVADHRVFSGCGQDHTALHFDSCCSAPICATSSAGRKG